MESKIYGMKPQTHQITIGNSNYLVQGSNTETLKDIAKVIGFSYDKIEPTPIPDSQKIIKVWAIGKLKDHLDAQT
jgi:hypothetical protein